MSRDCSFVNVIVLREIVRAGINTIGANATIGIGDEHSALSIDGRINKVEQVPIVFTDRVRGHSKMTVQVAAEEMTLVTWWGVRDRLLRRSR